MNLVLLVNLTILVVLGNVITLVNLVYWVILVDLANDCLFDIELRVDYVSLITHVNQISFLSACQLPSTNKTGNEIKSRSFESFCTILSPDLALTSFLRGIFGHPILNEGTIFTFSMTNCGTYFCILTDPLALPSWSQFPLILGHLFHIAMHC